MSNLSEYIPDFPIIFFVITLNCSNILAQSQLLLEENSSESTNSNCSNIHQEEVMHILKEENQKLKEKLEQAKKERKNAKSSALAYYTVKTLPFICYGIAPHIAPVITQMLNKLSYPLTKNSYQNNNNNKENNNPNENKELDLTSHLLCQTIAALFNMYVEKQAITEEFKKGKVKTLKDILQEKKENKKNMNKQKVSS